MCVLVHLGWAVAATGCAMGTAALGVVRWLLPATLLLLGLLQVRVRLRLRLGLRLRLRLRLRVSGSSPRP